MSDSKSYSLVSPKKNRSAHLLPIKAAVAFKAAGGKLVSKDGTDDFKLAVAADTEISGWAEITGSLTIGAAITPITVCDDLEQDFELPAGAAFTVAEAIALLNKSCDLKDTNTAGTTVQSCNQAASATDVLVIKGYDFAKQTFICRLNPAKMFATGAV